MITVILATRNGADTLPYVLEAYSKIRQPDGGWELVIVDNGSTDETPSFLERFKCELPLVTLYEERPGKNVALNAAVDHAKGELVVLTDDDAVPEEGMLCGLLDASRSQPAFDVFGGKVEPWWWAKPPKWLRACGIFDTAVCTAGYALTPGEIESGPVDPGMVFGPNMAVRRRIFDEGYRFDETIGPRPGGYAMGSETEFTARLHRDGYRAWYTPEARVRHIIQADQLSREWLGVRALKAGAGQYRKFARNRDDWPKELAGAPRYLWRVWLGYELRRLLEVGRRDESREFEMFWWARHYRGMIREARSASRMMKGLGGRSDRDGASSKGEGSDG